MPAFVDPIEMQHRLFAELSRMFGAEVPMYDRSLLVNRIANRTVGDLLAVRHRGFTISDEQIERTSGERHGAIRIGRPDEYHWIARYFRQFGMRPHNFYDMTSVGAKSQPIIASAFRSSLDPEHRVFTSLLQTRSFDPDIRRRIDDLLATRQVFSDRAMELIARGERDGGLGPDDADALIAEGTGRIFAWTGRARNHRLYTELCDAGLKIAADIACFETHHLNHLTPNTLCMDLYTASMKFVLGEWDEHRLRARGSLALARMVDAADGHVLRLLFRHLDPASIEGFTNAAVDDPTIGALVDDHVAALGPARESAIDLDHNGFKDSTEGPSWNTPILLRQDAYRALTEPVVFREDDGTEVASVHTARFGEIEQRGWATTRAGRELYDACLAEVEADRIAHPDRGFDAAEAASTACFDRFPSTLPALLEAGLVFGRWSATGAGRAAAGSVELAEPLELVRRGLARVEGLRYESFLPVSAAGIFASNLQQYGTRTDVDADPEAARAHLEELVGGTITDPVDLSAAIEAASLLELYDDLKLTGELPAARLSTLRDAAALLDVAGVRPAATAARD